MTIHPHRTRTLPALLLGGVLLSACAGPVAPIEVGTQTVQVALVLGEREAIVSAPAPVSPGPPPVALPPALTESPPPTIIRVTRPAPPPSPAPSPSPSPPPEKCPEFSPVDPVIAADPVASDKPAEASYPYRTQISGSLGGDEIAFEGDTTWAFGDVVDNSDGSFSYTAEVSDDEEPLTSTTWRVKPEGTEVRTDDTNPLGLLPSDPPEAAVPVEAGFYLDSMLRYDGTTFDPSSPIPIVQFPLTSGETFQTSGSDGVSTMAFTSTVGDRVKVNACGTPLQAWQIELTEGTFSTTASNGTEPVVNFTRTIWFTPQFGGIVVSDVTATTGSGTPGFPADSLAQSYTINVQPQPAAVDE